MTMIKHEWKRGGISLAVWTAAIGLLLGTCILIFPDMKDEMDGIGDMFASMGSFTEAFGMDQVNFGTLTGFYAVECGNILGLGGAFFASLCAVSVLAKEERDRTAEFLFTHPVSRLRIVSEKLIAVLLQIITLNVVVYLCAVLSIMVIDEAVPWREISLLHLAYLLLQFEFAGICFGISAFLRRGGMGIGLGVAGVMYFLNLIANISEQAEFLKYITPFGYAEGADIVTELCLDWTKAGIGLALGTAGAVIGCVKYCRKDIV